MYTCNIEYWKLLCAESATRLTGSVAIGGELDKHVSQDGLIGTEDPHAHLHVPDLLHDHVGRTVKSHTHRVWRRERELVRMWQYVKELNSEMLLKWQ